MKSRRTLSNRNCGKSGPRWPSTREVDVPDRSDADQDKILILRLIELKNLASDTFHGQPGTGEQP